MHIQLPARAEIKVEGNSITGLNDRLSYEYKYVTLYCIGQLFYDEMFRQLEIAIHQFAKRQMTWFRGMEERRGIPIHWIDATLPHEEKVRMVMKLL